MFGMAKDLAEKFVKRDVFGLVGMDNIHLFCPF